MTRAILAGTLLAAAATIAISAPSASSTRALVNPQAPVRIDLFSDFQCPSCKVLHERTIKPLMADYVNTGKVYLVQHEFPLPAHAHAREAACYACAAEKIGKYQQVGDELFQTQEIWAQNGKVAEFACSVLSADEAAKVRALAASPEIAKIVDENIKEGQGEAIGQTPTMIISKMIRRWPVPGAITYPVLRRFIDSLLTNN